MQLLLLLFFVVLLPVVIFGGTELRAIIRYWKILLTVPVLLFFFHVLFYPGRTVFHLWLFRITDEGLLEASLYSLKLFCSILALVVFLATTEIKSLIVGLIRFKVPSSFAYAIYLMLRFVPVMATEAKSIAQALKTRFAKGIPLRFLVRVWYRYLLTLVLLGVRRSEQTALAMDARGFVLGRRRTFLSEPTWGLVSTLFLASIFVVSWGIAFVGLNS